MALEAWIEDARDGRVTLEEAREGERAVALVPYTEGERLQPSLQQEARVRIERAAEMVERLLDRGHAGGAADDGAGDDVGVSVEVLRGAVDDDVEALLDRPVVERSGAGVVDD